MEEERREKDLRKRFKNLVKSGHISFAGGAWTQNTNSDWLTQSNSIEVGTIFLKEAFDIDRPTTAWYLDSTFGHSSATPDLLSLHGYDSVILSQLP